MMRETLKGTRNGRDISKIPILFMTRANEVKQCNILGTKPIKKKLVSPVYFSSSNKFVRRSIIIFIALASDDISTFGRPGRIYLPKLCRIWREKDLSIKKKKKIFLKFFTLGKPLQKRPLIIYPRERTDTTREKCRLARIPKGNSGVFQRERRQSISLTLKSRRWSNIVFYTAVLGVCFISIIIYTPDNSKFMCKPITIFEYLWVKY